MAAISIPPSPQVLSTMTTRRVPLANVPNATNSPLRPVAVTAKRARSYANEQRELAYGQPPPKKQIVEVDDAEARRGTLLRRAGYGQPTPLQRKLEAIRDNKPISKATERVPAASQENLETIRQWQKHYRKAFPQFVFYFESIPDNVRASITRQIYSLGAVEEKFFSKAVTHVITSRPIPSEAKSSSHQPSKSATLSNALDLGEQAGQPPKTINPSLLDQRNKFAFETSLSKRTQPAGPTTQDGEPRKQPNSGDILYKARELGIKIWALEKLQRMMTTMFNADTGEQAPQPRATRGDSASLAHSKARRDADLQRLLQNERLNGPADGALGVSTKDMVQFRGYYIYIHDMDEKTRPAMARDYPKSQKKEEGKWPQFRLTGPGKCPFVEDAAHIKRLHLQEQQKASQRNAERPKAAPRTRAAAAIEAAKERAEPAERQALAENNNVARRGSVAEESADKMRPLDPPKTIPAKRVNPDAQPPLFGSAQASLRAMPRFVAGEPVASGVQPSNVTSAIRSQMISSTAAAPGARAGTSKEVHQLKRKLLEKNSGPSANSMTSSYMNDVRAAINGERIGTTRAAKRKAKETLAQIHEDPLSDDEDAQLQKLLSRKEVKRELKPGYCENCREKFNDFDEHVTSRKHRKFALESANWRELDDLLDQLSRPIKEV